MERIRKYLPEILLVSIGYSRCIAEAVHYFKIGGSTIMKPSEKVIRPITDQELQRRWAAVRKGMEERKIDVLLMQNNNDFMGGNVKYFTDIPAVTGYPVTVTFPREGGMSVVCQGAMSSERILSLGACLLRSQWLNRPEDVNLVLLPP